MRGASTVAAVAALLMASIAAVLSVRTWPDQPQVWILVAVPITLSSLAIMFLRAGASTRLWVLLGFAILFLILTAFSLGPFFWPTTLALGISTFLAQIMKGRQGPTDPLR